LDVLVLRRIDLATQPVQLPDAGNAAVQGGGRDAGRAGVKVCRDCRDSGRKGRELLANALGFEGREIRPIAADCVG
jgi:hypothetical protein